MIHIMKAKSTSFRAMSVALLCAIFLLLINATSAWAAAGNPMDITTALCRVINLLTGSVGQAISVIAIIALGIGMFLGKVNWGIGLAVVAAMGLIFGANTLVMLISQNDDQGQVCTPEV